MAYSYTKKTDEKTYKVAFGVFEAVIILVALSLIITGIVFWSNSANEVSTPKSSYYSYQVLEKTEKIVNGFLVGMGFAYFFGGLIFFIVMTLLNRVAFGVIYDIRGIRNSLENHNTENVSNANESSVIFKDAPSTRSGSRYVANPGSGEWICPECGKTNQGYVGTCGCGGKKP